MRSFVIVCITGVALVIPDFTVFLDIAGALGAGVIAFILPPLLYNKEFEDTVPAWKKYTNWAICVFGVVGCTLSIVSSIQEIVNGDDESWNKDLSHSLMISEQIIIEPIELLKKSDFYRPKIAKNPTFISPKLMKNPTF